MNSYRCKSMKSSLLQQEKTFAKHSQNIRKTFAFCLYAVKKRP